MNKGLYSADFEKDACGIGFIAQINNVPSHKIVQDGLTMLKNMEHRGGVAADGETGDGAGILTQIPLQYFKREALKEGVILPENGGYGVAMVFMPNDVLKAEKGLAMMDKAIAEMGLRNIWVRKVPVASHKIGKVARDTEPKVFQIFVKSNELTVNELERKLFVLRKLCQNNAEVQLNDPNFYICSFSAKTIVYKGELRTWQLNDYFEDLNDELFQSSIAIIHSRFSTNTFPEWKLAQPFRFIAHNGEINTIKGNINKMLSKQVLLESTHFTSDEIDLLLPICNTQVSDSANLDLAVELLVRGGRSIEHVMTMLVPPAWTKDNLPREMRSFYEYHTMMMEPWDGPAALCFTDGSKIGASIDRNGLRPTRYYLTKDNRIVFASESGVLDEDPEEVTYRGKLEPGKMVLIDLEAQTIKRDSQIKPALAAAKPYRQWLERHLLRQEDFFKGVKDRWKLQPRNELLKAQLKFGYSKEDLKFILDPMATKASEPLGSMGNDTPLAVFARRNAHISNYFKQLFAQVSNPAIDPIRERSVMSLRTYLGSSQNLFNQKEGHARKLRIGQPILTPAQLAKIRAISEYGFKSYTLKALYIADFESLKDAIARICREAEDMVRSNVNLLVLSNRLTYDDFVPIPSLLITGAVHHHLLEKGLRAKVSLIIEAGDAIETHHYATLIGNGASAVCPYLAFDSILGSHLLLRSHEEKQELINNYIAAIGYGLRKILSKMGICTIVSYEGAQIFEVLGLDKEVIDLCFGTITNRLSGKGFDQLEREIRDNHRLALRQNNEVALPDGGIYQWRVEGEKHLFNPKTIHLLQKSTRSADYALFKEYASAINDQERSNVTLRSLFDFKTAKPIPLEEVEPIENILRRFSTGAMSFGSISEEAHTTIAKAMNLIGGKSNSGEGGEDAVRFKPGADGLLARSAIKQVASGRFGVTAHYLSNADEIQIKVAQGAKPGEGGQLPGLKVDKNIARIRHSTPGVTLISPPPHHDIYSIEDLAQLIFDLKNANNRADINVKLVSEAGVGTIAAGVAKANADAILISGHDGGTGASPLSSIHHTGIPWEIGLAEAHQTLMKNNLRNRVRLQTDGQIKTARDLAVATMLGAEEWGVATAVLVVEGCLMMRKCHLNTCPVGIATQNPALRKMFTGKVEDIVNFFRFMAMELREIMASVGVKSVNELVGRTDLLAYNRSKADEKAGSLDLTPILENPYAIAGKPQYKTESQNHRLESILDHRLIELSRTALEKEEKVRFTLKINNQNRATGAMLSGAVARKFGANGLAEDTIGVEFKGVAGQSFGAFLNRGISFDLEGEANDYVGKGLSGGKLIVYPHITSDFKASENVVIGNVALYGATSGELYVNGKAGERFAVRNSGASAVVEGIGDHGCEYMTGGKVVILGETGKNFAAGMSGGIAYVYAKGFDMEARCNPELVEFERPGQDDFDEIFDLLDKHFMYAYSIRAFEIMSEWEESKHFFVKVIPTEYKKVIEQEQAETAKVKA
jgi:glutamate synthase (NADPH/NADH) large chain